MSFLSTSNWPTRDVSPMVAAFLRLKYISTEKIKNITNVLFSDVIKYLMFMDENYLSLIYFYRQKCLELNVVALKLFFLAFTTGISLQSQFAKNSLIHHTNLKEIGNFRILEKLIDLNLRSNARMTKKYNPRD